MKKILNKILAACRFATVLAAILIGQHLFAQEYKLSGNIKDDEGKPVIGASVVVVGSTRGTSSDGKGNYTLSVKKGETIQASFLGYDSQSRVIDGQTSINFSLASSNNNINEVVVVGYGTSKRADLTGSVSSLNASQVEGFKSSSVLNAMSGQIAGVQISSQDGAPGGGVDIKIRGIGTITGDAGPLYIVDGFQVENIDYLSNKDIQSIEILKDASAAAIYGSRGANGVVLVTTKSGEAGRNIVNVSTSASYREITKKIGVLNPYEFVKLQVELGPSNAAIYFKPGNDDFGVPYRYQSLDDYIGVPGIDWQDEVFNPTWSFDTNISLQGGTNNTKYNLSFTNYKEDGIFVNSGYDKNAAKFRINQTLNKVISIDLTVNYVATSKFGIGTSGDSGRLNMLTQILQARPTGGLALSDEDLLQSAVDPYIEANEPNLAQVNPLKQAQSVDDMTKSQFWQTNMSINFKLAKNLSLRSSGSYSTNNIRRDIFYHEGSKEAYRAGQKPLAQASSKLDLRWSVNNYLTYNFSRNRHKFQAMLGQEIVCNSSKYLQGNANQFTAGELGSDNMGLGVPTAISSLYTNKGLMSFFTRVNYSFSDRYLLTGTLRYDGSSVFADSNKWSVSPSFSFAWRINEENFLKNSRVISNLKFRAGWGVVGNDRIPSFLSMDLYELIKYGVVTDIQSVFINKQLPNSDIGWESSMTTNVGVDIGLLKNKISLTVDAFLKDTRNLLLNADKPYVSGFQSQYMNVGKIRNKGIELTLNTVNIQRPNGFMWKTDFNISFIRNSLVSLVGGQQSRLDRSGFDGNIANDYIAIIGRPLGMMYGYMVDGVYQHSDFDINASTGQMNLKPGITDISKHLGVPVKPGSIKYRDIDNNGYIDENDRTVIGNGTPKYFGGITNSMFYKGIDFSFMFQFNYGNDIYNATRLFLSQSDLDKYNRSDLVANRWTETNATNEMHSARGFQRNDVTSQFIEDGSFLRLKNVAIGYTFPRKLTSKIRLERVRVYASAQNLWTLTNYTGSDPEVSMRASNPMTPGVDFGAYPKSRILSFGLDIQF